MSKTSWQESDDQIPNSSMTSEAREGQVQDDSYATTGQRDGSIPVKSDDARVESPVKAADADTDAQLGTQASEGRLAISSNRAQREMRRKPLIKPISSRAGHAERNRVARTRSRAATQI